MKSQYLHIFARLAQKIHIAMRMGVSTLWNSMSATLYRFTPCASFSSAFFSNESTCCFSEEFLRSSTFAMQSSWLHLEPVFSSAAAVSKTCNKMIIMRLALRRIRRHQCNETFKSCFKLSHIFRIFVQLQTDIFISNM